MGCLFIFSHDASFVKQPFISARVLALHVFHPGPDVMDDGQITPMQGP